MRIESTVHYSRRFDNAMWDGKQMVYGDGDGRIFNRFTVAKDVIGHELTHGVTQYTAGLGYSGQTGALNEHLSDAFGIMVKQYVLGQTLTNPTGSSAPGCSPPGSTATASVRWLLPVPRTTTPSSDAIPSPRTCRAM